MSHENRLRLRRWMADRALALGGLALVALGSTGSPTALTLGWAALGFALFAFVAEAEGVAVPRAGRAVVAIRPPGYRRSPTWRSEASGGRTWI